jgi:LPPG:FO 2-phospho-L-lactate transferase
MITVLTGGTGGAKFVDGLRHVVPPEEITLIVNTGDDFEWWGLQISPDLDSITYVLANLLSKERGWGVQDDTFQCLEMMKRMQRPAWFQIGDRDLAIHLSRTELIKEGRALSGATAEIAAGLGIREKILPMTDDRVETRVTVADGEISFQEYFVQRRHRDAVSAVRFVGAQTSHPAPGVLEAILSADAIIFAPSNPITSIGPILAVPGIRAALLETAAPIAAISPIVGGAAVSGPAGGLMESQGLPSSVAGVAQAYADFLDTLIVDRADESAVKTLRETGLNVQCTDTVMKSTSDRIELARRALATVLSAEQTPMTTTTNPGGTELENPAR